jgi:plastocyanin
MIQVRQSIIIFLFLILGARAAVGTTHTIISSGFTFSPNSITITLGDTVVFALGSIHTAREVSLPTWNAGGTTSNGGFDLPFGGGTVVLQSAGPHYYVCTVHVSFGMKGTIIVNNTTDVRESGGPLPATYTLSQNYPNPFNPSTTFEFQLPERAALAEGGGQVTLSIYDITGQRVATIVSGTLPPGTYTARWDASAFPSGIYFYRLDAGAFSMTKKLLFIR